MEQLIHRSRYSQSPKQVFFSHVYVYIYWVCALISYVLAFDGDGLVEGLFFFADFVFPHLGFDLSCNFLWVFLI